MKIEAYPEQEPKSEGMVGYHRHLMELAKNLQGHEAQYGEDPYQSIVVFPAEKPSGKVLLYFHGGGWTNGYKEWMAFMAPALNKLGITFASAGYRLAPQHPFPAGLNDCAAALAWLAGNVAQFGGDPGQIFVGGHSAGGHYASLLSVNEGKDAGPGQPALIRGCAPVSGVYYFGDDSGMAVRPRFLGDPALGNDVVASPILQLGDRACPFLISYGESDFPHLVRQAQDMVAKLEQKGLRVQTLVLPGCNHFTASYAAGEVDGIWPNTLNDWMQSVVD
ncbi:alpha/beta hydrolase [Eoetvoesiella caeni]|uniref:Acetyl esterase/lipase n=1 Tax=Eoetvoesiella caeni TaxID=645616 RepID=A0A366HC73_9BURK|nr:alpha/beta hydrolase [Eoetvoesiella caeni]MCI2809098.1 alpha/beta hydrolase [Eoetvoesiella caeni]NYT55401.1 alpha/beta hydrolase [Eoetvoesiella caeni]RBP39953.1 acetyl esterase/lipase [Eoetvoesiella caeni]